MLKSTFEKVLNSISTLFILSDNLNSNITINEALASVGMALECDRSYYYSIDTQTGAIKVKNEWVRISGYHSKAYIEQHELNMGLYTYWRSLLQNPKLWKLDSLDELPAYAINEKKELISDRVGSLVLAPLFVNNELIGCTGFEFIEREHKWNDPEISFIEQFSTLFSAFLTRILFSRVITRGSETQAFQNIQSSSDEFSADMQFLSESGTALLGLDTKIHILEYVGEALYKLIPNSFIVVSDFLFEEQCIIPRIIKGTNPLVMQGIKTLGFEPIGRRYEIDINSKSFQIFKNWVLHKVEDGIHELSGGEVSRTKCKLIRSMLGIQEIYSCGFNTNGRVFGTATLFLRSKKPINRKLIESFLRMVSLALYREETHHKLLQSRKENQDLLDNMTEGVVSIDMQGNITYMNRAAIDISGYKRHEIIGRSAGIFLTEPEKLEEYLSNINRFSSFGNPITELTIISKNGDLKLIEVSSIELLDKKNQVNGILSVISDVTQLKRKEAILLEYELEKRIIDIKQRFLSNMSHEMLTPLNGIYGVSQILSDRNLPDDNHELVTIIGQSSEQLLQVISSIWDALSLKEGIQKVYPRKFGLCDMMLHNKELFLAAAKEKSIELKLEYDKFRHEYLIGDEIKINQVISNLLGNAIKFQKNGGEVVFRVTCKAKESNSILLRFDIIDNGTGIPEEKHYMMFSLFEQVDNSLTREYEGLGLGLTIARELVTLMKGEIGFSSKPNQGSHFWFEIPVERIPPGENLPGCSCAGKTI